VFYNLHLTDTQYAYFFKVLSDLNSKALKDSKIKGSAIVSRAKALEVLGRLSVHAINSVVIQVRKFFCNLLIFERAA